MIFTFNFPHFLSTFMSCVCPGACTLFHIYNTSKHGESVEGIGEEYFALLKD